MASSVGLIGCLIVVVAVLDGAAAEEYIVGDAMGWTVPPNTTFYTEWTSDKKFKIGDTVVFNWTGDHTAIEVSKEYYDNCTQGGISIEKQNKVPINLTANYTLYYICTIDSHCQRGQKLTLVIGDGLLDPYTNTGRGLSPSLNVGALTAVLSAIPIFFFSYI